MEIDTIYRFIPSFREIHRCSSIRISTLAWDFGLTSLYLFLRILTVQYLKDFSSSLSVNHLFPCHSRFVTYAISISLQIFLPVERKRWSSNPSHFLMLRGWFLKILQKIQTFFAINKIAQKNKYLFYHISEFNMIAIIIFEKYYF